MLPPESLKPSDKYVYLKLNDRDRIFTSSTISLLSLFYHVMTRTVLL